MVVSTDPQREQVMELMKKKEKTEKKISDLGLVLQTNNVQFYEALTDADGFPRSDIDVRNVRIARTQIICLQNDLKELTKSIEEGLEKYFHESKEHLSSPKIPPEALSNASHGIAGSTSSNQNETPIVIVNLVSPGSPAEDAGLELRDLVVSFGSVNANNFNNTAQIGELVKNAENTQVHIRIKRHGKIEDLILVPKKWSGRGLLGCNIVPFVSTLN